MGKKCVQNAQRCEKILDDVITLGLKFRDFCRIEGKSVDLFPIRGIINSNPHTGQEQNGICRLDMVYIFVSVSGE